MAKRQRDELGRFVKGHDAVGAGRPPKPVEEKYFETFKRTVSFKDWAEATRALLERAKDGDVKAYKILAEYIMGKPTQYVNAQVETRSDISGEFARMLDRVYGVSETGASGGESEDSA